MPKKDFAGKNKTKDTYTGDLVFVKNKHTKGPNHSAGAWMTKKQAKKLKQDNKPSGPAAAAPAPGTPGVPATVPINPAGTVPIPGTTTPTSPWVTGKPGGPIPTLPTPGPHPGRRDGGTEATPTSQTAYNTIPSWWVNQAYSNPDQNQAFANAANSLLPYLSPEDQRNMARYLATNYKDVYGSYANANFGPIPTTVGEAERKAYLSGNRAQEAMGILDRMKAASGGKDLGTGYEFLRNAVGLINQYSSGPMTREQYDQFSKAVSDFNATATNDQKAYANLAQLFNLPSFSAGSIVNNAPNSKLFA